MTTPLLKLGDTITVNIEHPHPATIRMTLATPASVAYANELLADPSSGWTEAPPSTKTMCPHDQCHPGFCPCSDARRAAIRALVKDESSEQSKT